MIVCKNELSLEEVKMFQDYWKNNQDRSYVNWQLGDEILDQRLVIEKGTPEFAVVKRIVDKYFTSVHAVWAAHQIQTFAHHIHVDEYWVGKPGYVYTFIFSMNTEPRFKTYVWKECAYDGQEVHKMVHNWGENRQLFPRKNCMSVFEDLEHTYDENQDAYFCDYLDVDGVYSYEIGSGALFKATQLHCTSNWKKYPDIEYRELLQIHVASNFPINC